MSAMRPSARSVLLNVDTGEYSEDEINRRERQFFNQLVLANGTLKTTFAGRLTEVDSVCNRLLQGLSKKVDLLDIAVSSGVTTHEWVSALNATGLDFSIDAFDICADGVICSRGEHFNVLVDSANRPLQFELFGKVFENSLGESVLRKLKRFVPILILRALHYSMRGLLGGYRQETPVKLVTRHLQNSENIRVLEFDLADMDQLPRTYDMIRAANILNLAYFDEAFLKDAVAKVQTRLKRGGYLCVVRTHSDSSNHGTIYINNGDRFSAVETIGSGSEIDQIVKST